MNYKNYTEPETYFRHLNIQSDILEHSETTGDGEENGEFNSKKRDKHDEPEWGTIENSLW